MAGYLPLCSFRQGLLPVACRGCAWWQTAGDKHLSGETAAGIRRRWMVSIEDSWGSPGFLLQSDAVPGLGLLRSALSDAAPASDATAASGSDPALAADPAQVAVASIAFAPTAEVPRLQELPFEDLGPLPDGSALVFCLTCAGGQPPYQAKRVLHRAIRHLKTRGVSDLYAVAGRSTGAEGLIDRALRHHELDRDRCRFFSAQFLGANGFHPVITRDGLTLMRADLRGLLTLVGQMRSAVRRLASDEPAPSPAAWTR